MILISIILLGFFSLAGCSKSPTSEPKVKKAKAKALAEKLADGSGWANPVLRLDGRSLTLNPGGKKVSEENFIPALRSLPASAWPAGKKVAIEFVTYEGDCTMSHLRRKIDLERAIDNLRGNGYQPASWETQIPLAPGKMPCGD